MTVQQAGYFPENDKILSIDVYQSDSPEIPGGLHKGYVDIVFRHQWNEDLHHIEGVHRLEGLGSTQLLVRIDPRYDAFDVAKRIGQYLEEKKYMTHDELIALYKELDTAVSLPDLQVKGVGKGA